MPLVVSLAVVLALAATGSPSATGPTSAPNVADLLRDGDLLYARRGEGAEGARARPDTIEAALEAYRRALALEPRSAEVVWRLQRAAFFRAVFCGASREDALRVMDEARRRGEEALAPLRTAVRGLAPAARLDVLRRTPETSRLYLWSAVCWGQWAVVRGKLASAREGVGPRIRDLAQTVIDLDPALEEGGGDRLLGRLHDQAPKIPFITGWVSRREALSHLRRAVELGPANKVNQFFLAEAILDHDAAHLEDARALLERCASEPPRAEFRVEDVHFSGLARERLKTLR